MLTNSFELTLLADFYELTKEHLLTLDGWKEKSAERFLNSLKESRNVPFERVVFALGIRHVGETTAKSLARHFKTIDAMAAAETEELLGVDDIGEIIAESVYSYFRNPDNMEVITRLKASGLRFELGEQKASISNTLDGLTIVISGNFSIPRDKMKELIVLHGGKNSGSISGKTSYLLAGEKSGPEKLKKAEALGVKVITETEFMEMIAADQSLNEITDNNKVETIIEPTLF